MAWEIFGVWNSRKKQRIYAYKAGETDEDFTSSGGKKRPERRSALLAHCPVPQAPVETEKRHVKQANIGDRII